MSIRRLAAALLILCLLPAIASAATYTVTHQVRSDMPTFLFALDYDKVQHIEPKSEEGGFGDEIALFYVRAITVTHNDTGALVQQIALDPPAETYDDETLGFIMEDMNFDGFDDMRVMRYVSGGSSISFSCFLWDSAAQRFAHNEALSAIPSPMFDAERREVRGFGALGDMEFTDTTYTGDDESTYTLTGRGSEYVDTTYMYSGDALVLVSRVTTAYDYGSGQAITTTEQLIDGAMTVTGVSREPLFDLEEFGLDD